MKIRIIPILFLGFVCTQICLGGVHDSAPAPDIEQTPAGNRPTSNSGDSPDKKKAALLDAMCGKPNHEKHFVCDKIKPVVEKFYEEQKAAQKLIKLEKLEEGYKNLSLAIQNLVNSIEGVESIGDKNNTCSINDGGPDIWARDSNKVLKEIYNQGDTAVKQITINEQAGIWPFLTQMSADVTRDMTEEQRLALNVVKNNRIEMYGKALHLSNNLTKTFIEQLSEQLHIFLDHTRGDEAMDKAALEAGKILAVHLDSMSAAQKEELAHFANTFPNSRADQDLRQAIQLAMSNWSKKDSKLAPQETPDKCFTANDKIPYAKIKEGFLKAMNKEGDVAKNRSDFWETVKAATSETDPAKKTEAKNLLISKWGSNLPAYMQSLRNVIENPFHKGDEQHKVAEQSLAKIVAAVGDISDVIYSDPNSHKTKIYSVAMEDRNNGVNKPVPVKVRGDTKYKEPGSLPENIKFETSAPKDMRNLVMAKPRASALAAEGATDSGRNGPALAENIPEVNTAFENAINILKSEKANPDSKEFVRKEAEAADTQFKGLYQLLMEDYIANNPKATSEDIVKALTAKYTALKEVPAEILKNMTDALLNQIKEPKTQTQSAAENKAQDDKLASLTNTANNISAAGAALRPFLPSPISAAMQHVSLANTILQGLVSGPSEQQPEQDISNGQTIKDHNDFLNKLETQLSLAKHKALTESDESEAEKARTEEQEIFIEAQGHYIKLAQSNTINYVQNLADNLNDKDKTISELKNNKDIHINNIKEELDKTYPAFKNILPEEEMQDIASELFDRVFAKFVKLPAPPAQTQPVPPAQTQPGPPAQSNAPATKKNETEYFNITNNYKVNDKFKELENSVINETNKDKKAKAELEAKDLYLGLVKVALKEKVRNILSPNEQISQLEGYTALNGSAVTTVLWDLQSLLAKNYKSINKLFDEETLTGLTTQAHFDNLRELQGQLSQ